MDKQKFNDDIGYKLWQFRMEYGLSRVELARFIGVSHQQCEKYEKGINRISAGTLAAIIHHWKLNPGYFFVSDKPSVSLDYTTCENIAEGILGLEKESYRDFMLSTLRLLKTL